MIFLTPESSARSLIDRGSIVSWCWWRVERARSNDGAVTRGMGQPPTWRLALDLIQNSAQSDLINVAFLKHDGTRVKLGRT